MKKFLAILLAALMMLSMVACNITAGGEATEITLWTYPIGNWGTEAELNKLLDAFHEAHPEIKVTVEYLTYSDGDQKVNAAIEGNEAPDLIMEGPERLVANWGAKGLMVDLSDILVASDVAEINAAAMSACYGTDGKIYEYPLVMTAHCMAINKTVFEAAGALEHIDLEKHTWKSVEDFKQAVAKVYAHTGEIVGAVYCNGQGGDQGTRALVNNLKGGTFTNAAHTEYTWNSAENIAALEMLKGMDGIAYDASIVGGDEIKNFYNGTFQMAFCWNIAMQLNPNNANTGAEKTASGDEIEFLAFPSDGEVKLQGGIWGFGIFNNGDDKKIEAAKTFIKYMCDSEATIEAVKTANYFAVRNTAEGVDLSKIWEGNDIMAEYNKLMPMLGDYYQVTTNWAEARTCWWEMLQDVGEGRDVAEAVQEWCNKANGK